MEQEVQECSLALLKTCRIYEDLTQSRGTPWYTPHRIASSI
jgi:hypothetical protein